jgi:hypothetical protein
MERAARTSVVGLKSERREKRKMAADNEMDFETIAEAQEMLSKLTALILEGLKKVESQGNPVQTETALVLAETICETLDKLLVTSCLGGTGLTDD